MECCQILFYKYFFDLPFPSFFFGPARLLTSFDRSTESMEFFGMRRYQTGHFSCNHIVQYLIERKIPDFTIKSAFWIVKFLGIWGRVFQICKLTKLFGDKPFKLHVTLRYWLGIWRCDLNKPILVDFRSFYHFVSWQRSHTWARQICADINWPLRAWIISGCETG